MQLVSTNDPGTADARGGWYKEQAFVERLEKYEVEFATFARMMDSQECSAALKAVARDCGRLIAVLRNSRRAGY